MERITFDKLGSRGRSNFLNIGRKGHEFSMVNPAFIFLESGYFHVDDCEGDHHFYYRYLVNGQIIEMLEDDVHTLSKMTLDEREKFLAEHCGDDLHENN